MRKPKNTPPDVNGFGVPYHCYTLSLANGKTVSIDVGCEEDWGDIQRCLPWDCEDCEKAVGWGNDSDGHIKIIGVTDEETGKRLNVWRWAKRSVWIYVDNYSC